MIRGASKPTLFCLFRLIGTDSNVSFCQFFTPVSKQPLIPVVFTPRMILEEILPHRSCEHHLETRDLSAPTPQSDTTQLVIVKTGYAFVDFSKILKAEISQNSCRPVIGVV